MTQVGAMVFCDVDRDTFYAQKAPLFPGSYQRWIVALPDWGEKLTDEHVKRRVDMWLRGSGLNIYDYRAVKVLGFSTTQPSSFPNAKKVVSPIPEMKEGPLSSKPLRVFYVALEFWYDGKASELAWPWDARGFAIQCPEDTLGGLIAVMPPIKTPVAPPTVWDELHQPIQETVVELHDGARDAIKEIADSMPNVAPQVGGALSLLLWGGVGLVLWHLHSAASDARRAFK